MNQATNLKTTLLDHAILGLISGQSMSGYAIRKVFETTAMGNYSSSPGTIYPALRRLQKLGLADNLVAKEDGKRKYIITVKGKQAFRSWLTLPLTPKDISRKLDEILLRFGFMDRLSNKQKLLFLGSMRDLLVSYISELQDYLKTESESLPLHGKLSLEHGIESYKTTLKWCEKNLLLFERK